MRTTALIVAGGTGSRFAAAGSVDSLPKQFALLAGRPILAVTLERFARHDRIDGIVIVSHPDHVERTREIAGSGPAAEKLCGVVPGGESRQLSVLNGLESIDGAEDDIVVIHDAVRPLVTGEAITDSIEAAIEHGAADVVTRTTDTIVIADGAFIGSIPDRRALRNEQTPQTFRLGLIREAHRRAHRDGRTDFSDDVQLAMAMDHPVKLVEGPPENFKITTPQDLKLAELLLDGGEA